MRLVFFIVFLMFAAPAWATGPKVVVSLKPVHSLIAGVMGEAGAPHLLLAKGTDPHSHSLRPSEARALAEADAVFWIGPALEGFLQKPLSSLAGTAKVVALNESPGVRLRRARKGGIWEAHGHHDEAKHAHEHDHDPHIWLDPRNAQAMVRHAVAVLSELDPGQSESYRGNGERVLAELNDLEAEIRALLAQVRPLPYMVLHDAYQYFERRFLLNVQGAIAIDPDRKPGARRIAQIRQRLREGRIRCLFREAAYPAKMIDTLASGLDVRVASLDPVGWNVPPGPQAYGRILRQVAGSIENCLSYFIGP